ncbi:type IV pilus biogenesis/stability protein PilW [Pseudoxanthomonas wuyuanensis]|uniref:Type IV pilus assembly protein PilF n=1 Tax=Pseudoxanthomonas wuyuanensis TaxID=1073196 RepID=A0A286CZL2_9GAMM|nr:type IV pilus biogenesis/stability protein PilW [Pseudoxanthomonas wuyuanensis]KAF1722352.1 type IV pilus biogenesis/stability protein PilW [Pseudoxanthomonas wuyuanensis]SOD51799.1 type IV pilus assembly protein PilF [Pseudoxanthomonas wuyuanensis]
MRLREGGWLLALAVLLLGGCSRLTFIKPKMQRKDGEQIAQDYQVSDSPATKRRLADQQRMARATQRVQSGDFDAAEREVKAILKSSPESADANTLMAVIEDRRGRSEQAGAYYRRAAELAPGNGGVQNNYGAWLCGNGFAAESLVWFDRALAAPDYATPASALANAGGCALKSGQYERAERDLRQALALEPGNPFALGAMAESEFHHRRYFEARAFVERRLAAAPASADMLKLASQIEERLGDRTAASRYVQRLRAEFPGTVEANLGGNAVP